MPPLPGNKGIRPGQLIIYDGFKDGDKVRVAAFALSLKGTSANGVALVQVGETLSRRLALADRATLAIVIPMLLMTLTAAAAIAYGVGRGLEPVGRLRDRLSARKAFDLSPVPLEGTPAELRPFLDEINSLLQRLSEAVEAQSRFVSDAAHQLRTPIAGIRAQAEAALASARHEDAQHALARIAQSTQTMGDLVQKLLILARVDAAENTLRLNRVDAAELVREVAREWAPPALDKGVEIGFEMTGGEAWVMGDAQLLREMLANLIDNALRYGGTRITLTVSRSEQGVTWRVADNGPGIPEQHACRSICAISSAVERRGWRRAGLDDCAAHRASAWCDGESGVGRVGYRPGGECEISARGGVAEQKKTAPVGAVFIWTVRFSLRFRVFRCRQLQERVLPAGLSSTGAGGLSRRPPESSPSRPGLPSGGRRRC